jgi:hypothetical protein
MIPQNRVSKVRRLVTNTGFADERTSEGFPKQVAVFRARIRDMAIKERGKEPPFRICRGS